MTNIRVLVVDDSAFSRRTITKMLDEAEGIEVVGYAVDGEDGIQQVIELKPDLVTMDLEMPRMDGFTLLRIIKQRFSIPVIVVSALSAADKVFKALELGAFDFVAKPQKAASPELLQIRNDLLEKVRHVALAHQEGRGGETGAAAASLETLAPPPPSVLPDSDNRRHSFEVVAIGSSTGGPQALQGMFTSFERQYPFAVVVSQHMPVGFTKAFAERLNRLCRFDVKEAADGDPVLPGRILIAPGGCNMLFERRDEQVVARIVKPAATDRYIPSVDAMLESCAEIFREKVLAIILTGMGNDGARGVRAVSGQGGYVIAEAEESSVVYGMPREAVATGMVNQVLPLRQIADEILRKGDYL